MKTDSSSRKRRRRRRRREEDEEEEGGRKKTLFRQIESITDAGRDWAPEGAHDPPPRRGLAACAVSAEALYQRLV